MNSPRLGGPLPSFPNSDHFSIRGERTFEGKRWSLAGKTFTGSHPRKEERSNSGLSEKKNASSQKTGKERRIFLSLSLSSPFPNPILLGVQILLRNTTILQSPLYVFEQLPYFSEPRRFAFFLLFFLNIATTIVQSGTEIHSGVNQLSLTF